MEFKINFEIKGPKTRLNIRKPVFLSGSCFTEHIGNRLREVKFKTIINPNGILFNPLSITHSLVDCANNSPVNVNHLFEHNELWYSWDHHGEFSAATKEELMDQITEARKQANSILKEADWIFITLGSAWVYELISTNEIVANCHKVPQAKFTKRLLSVKEIIAAFEEMMNHELLQNKQFMVSISPVRYSRDGLVENNQRDRKSTRLNSSHSDRSRMPSSA